MSNKIVILSLAFVMMMSQPAMAKCVAAGELFFHIPALGFRCGVWHSEWKSCTQDSECVLLSGSACASDDMRAVNEACLQEANGFVECTYAAEDCFPVCETKIGTVGCVQHKAKCVFNKCIVTGE